MSRQYTDDEVREMLSTHIFNLIDFWEKNSTRATVREKLSGLAFSILSTLDGCSDLPAFIVAPDPHQDDKEYHIQRGENWFPENHETEINCDLPYLHETFGNYDPNR